MAEHGETSQPSSPPDPSSRSAWEQRYGDGNTGWDRGESSPMLRAWFDSSELRPCRIIVPGCGYGHEVIELAKLAFEVTAIDFAAPAVGFLKHRLSEHQLSAHVAQADLLRWAPDEPVDAIYEQTCLCAIAPRDRALYAVQLAKWLKPGGKLLALFMQCTNLEQQGPPFHCSWEEMQTLFAPPTWNWPSQDPVSVPHPTGLHELAVVLERA